MFRFTSRCCASWSFFLSASSSASSSSAFTAPLCIHEISPCVEWSGLGSAHPRPHFLVYFCALWVMPPSKPYSMLSLLINVCFYVCVVLLLCCLLELWHSFQRCRVTGVVWWSPLTPQFWSFALCCVVVSIWASTCEELPLSIEF